MSGLSVGVSIGDAADRIETVEATEAAVDGLSGATKAAGDLGLAGAEAVVPDAPEGPLGAAAPDVGISVLVALQPAVVADAAHGTAGAVHALGDDVVGQADADGCGDSVSVGHLGICHLIIVSLGLLPIRLVSSVEALAGALAEAGDAGATLGVQALVEAAGDGADEAA